MKRFKIEKIINSAQFTLEHSLPLEKYTPRENPPMEVNSLVLVGPFLDSKYELNYIVSQISDLIKSY